MVTVVLITVHHVTIMDVIAAMMDICYRMVLVFLVHPIVSFAVREFVGVLQGIIFKDLPV